MERALGSTWRKSCRSFQVLPGARGDAPEQNDGGNRRLETLPSIPKRIELRCGREGTSRDRASFSVLTAKQAVVIHFRMTDLIAFRPKRPKRELQERFGNVSEKLNELIERELAGHSPSDWRGILKRARPKLEADDYNRCLTPE
jgi:hypothetical protein